MRSLGEDVDFVAVPCLREGMGRDGKGAGWDVGCGLGRVYEWRVDEGESGEGYGGE